MAKRTFHNPGRGAIPQYLRINYAKFDADCTRLYREGFSTYVIAEKLKRSQGAVARSLRRTKTPRRSYIQAEQMRQQMAA